MKQKLHWLTPEHDLGGNALGYNTHNTFMRKYSAPFFDFDDNARMCLQITPGDQFFPVPGRFNILFTMWEATEVPETYIKSLKKADLIIVPSRFCKDIFRKHTDAPIEVCWEGVEAENFPFFQRSFPDYGKRFRYLWSGAPNPRKGTASIAQVAKLVETIPEMELYIKTTAQKYDHRAFITRLWQTRGAVRDRIKRGEATDAQSVKAMLERSKIRRTGVLDERISRYGKNNNVIMDTRKLPFDELVALYNSAHCFLLPTLGEGWGLTLCEAMATGCPSIATAVTGCADFFDDSVGYSIKYQIREWHLDSYRVTAGIHCPDTDDLAKKMIHVFNNYDEALRKGKRASDRIHNKFTWDKSGKRLYEIIKKYSGGVDA
jgi:glycosyltransferase involved in cell wall biosynthesis